MRQNRHLPWLIGALLLVGFGLFQFSALDTFERDYDEGVYLAEALLVHHGHGLYTEVASPSPPLFIWGLTSIFALAGGPNVFLTRLAIVGMGALGAISLAWSARHLAPRRPGAAALVGMGLLLLFPRWVLYGQLAMADIPSLSFSLLAVALALGGWQGGRRWFFVGGIAAGAALWTKILAAYTAPLLALIVLLSYRPQRPFALRTFILDGLATLAGFLLPIALTLPFLDLRAAYEVLIRFPWEAGRDWVDPANALRLMAIFHAEHLGWTILSLVGAVRLAAQRAWRPLALLVGWEALVIVMLSQHAPLWGHLLLPLAPPILLAGALGLAALPLRRLPLAVAGASLLLFALLWPQALTADEAAFSPPSRPTLLREEVVPWLQSIVAPDERILTDDPMIAVRAGRMVPHDMTDTSFTRIGSGFLTAADLIAATERDRPAAIIFWSDRFSTLPEWRAWVEANYAVGRQYASKRVIFIRPDLAPLSPY